MSNLLYELRKFLPAMLMPLTLPLVLIVAGIVRRRRLLAFAGVVPLFLASLPAVSDPLCRYLEGQYPHLQVSQSPAADVVVVLGGYAGSLNRYPGEIEW